MKRIMRKAISAASDEMSISDRLDDSISNLKDDFNYAISGLEKLSRDGDESATVALTLSQSFSESIQDMIDQILDSVQSDQD